MDYEKAYKEAIKRAKAIIEVAEKEEEVYKSAITIFPELCESEDEMIRKELIKHLKDGAEGYMPAGDSEDYARWLAWVEKQDEKKSQRMVSAEAKEALYDKPTDEEMKELLRTEYEKGRADAIAEMKSSWSEKDEKVIAIINNALTESNTPPDDYDKVYDWLESLRKRIGE